MELKARKSDGDWLLRGRPLAIVIAVSLLITVGVFVAAQLDAPRQAGQAYQEGLQALTAKDYAAALKKFEAVRVGPHVAEAKARSEEARRHLDEQRRQEEAAAAERDKEQKAAAERREREEKARQERQEAAARERERAAAEAEEARQRQAAKDFVESCRPLDYDAVARQPELASGRHFTFTAAVVQSVESGVLLVRPLGASDLAWVNYSRPAGESRVLEGDMVQIWATCGGLKSYTTALGAEKTIPEFDAAGVRSFGQTQ